MESKINRYSKQLILINSFFILLEIDSFVSFDKPFPEIYKVTLEKFFKPEGCLQLKIQIETGILLQLRQCKCIGLPGDFHKEDK